jgi:hypothetical protein
MTVYRLDPDNDHFPNFALVDESAGPIFRRFDGTPIGVDWRPLDISAEDTDDELALLGDHALLGTIPVFSERAVAALGDVLRRNGELLSLIYSRQSCLAFNVLTICDALDSSRSKVVRFSSGRVMLVDEFVFMPERLQGLTIFKIPELLRATVFVTDDFAHRVRSAGLNGFVFREVWRENAEG